MRGPTPGAERLLEWGTESAMPGSRVHDAEGRMIFTGSEVELIDSEQITGIPQQRGTVTDLLEATSVAVQWTTPNGHGAAGSKQLRVLADPPDLGRP